MPINRWKWGSMGGAVLSLAALMPHAPASAGDEVHVQDHGDGRYTLSSVLAGTSDPAQGLLAITPGAVALCDGLFPHFGRYRFEAQNPIEGQSDAGPASLEYAQDISCHDTPQDRQDTSSAPVPAAPDSPPTDEDAEAVRALTLAYFQAKEAADARAAYALFSSEMASYATPETWAATRSAFNAKVGPGAETDLARITWYDNPANAPVHGRYAAVDYGVAYPSQGFTCGYVVWLRQADGGYLIVREEEAQATPDIVASLSPEQVASMRTQLQCRD